MLVMHMFNHLRLLLFLDQKAGSNLSVCRLALALSFATMAFYGSRWWNRICAEVYEETIVVVDPAWLVDGWVVNSICTFKMATDYCATIRWVKTAAHGRELRFNDEFWREPNEHFHPMGTRVELGRPSVVIFTWHCTAGDEVNQLAAQLQVGAMVSESTSVPSTGTDVPDSVQPGWDVNDDSYPPPATVDDIVT